MESLEINNLHMKNLYKIIGTLALMALISVFVQKYPSAKADITGLPVYGPIPINASSTCALGLGPATGTSTSTPVVGTSTGSRTYIRITNISNGLAYLSLGQYPSTSTGITLTASSTWERDATQVLWMGSIYCEGDSSLDKTAPILSIETIGS